MRALALCCALLLTGCGTTSGVASGASASPTMTASPVPATATPPFPIPTKPTPCPYDFDTTAVNVTGSVLWNGAAIGGVQVEAFQPGAPGHGPVEASATSAADGTFRLRGLSARRPYYVTVSDQPGFMANGGTGVQLCERNDVALPPIVALRTIEGLSLERGATVPAGAQTLTWRPQAGADEYCVWVTTPGDASTFKRWTPEECTEEPSFPRGAHVVEPRYVTPLLPAGNVYDLGVYARANGKVVAALPRRSLRFAAAPVGNVGICADTTRDANLASNMPYWFFQVLDGSAAAELRTCLADGVPDRDALAVAFVASGGTSFLQLKQLTTLADGTPVWSATPRWKDAAAVGSWSSGETRWLLVKWQRDGHWAMEIATAAPR